jgi:prevent-host-death family protein
MSTVGLKELRSRLAEYLRRASRGEEVIVNDRFDPSALVRRFLVE